MGVEARVAQLSTLIGWLAEGIEPTVEAHEGGFGYTMSQERGAFGSRRGNP